MCSRELAPRPHNSLRSVAKRSKKITIVDTDGPSEERSRFVKISLGAEFSSNEFNARLRNSRTERRSFFFCSLLEILSGLNFIVVPLNAFRSTKTLYVELWGIRGEILCDNFKLNFYQQIDKFMGQICLFAQLINDHAQLQNFS